MGKLWIAGLGPGGIEKMTVETMTVIEQAERLILRTAIHPAATELSAKGIRYTDCDSIYERGGSFPEIYETIAMFVLAETEKAASVCYCVPGHPMVAEETVRIILRKAAEQTANMPEIILLPALSFLDSVWVSLRIDPLREHVAILDAAVLYDGNREGLLPLPVSSCLFAQVYHPFIAGELKLALLEERLPEAGIWILHHAGIEAEEELVFCPLAELDHYKKFDHLTSVFLPQQSGE